jgi:hypothetical protein
MRTRIAAVASAAISCRVMKNGIAAKEYDEESRPGSGGD